MHSEPMLLLLLLFSILIELIATDTSTMQGAFDVGHESMTCETVCYGRDLSNKDIFCVQCSMMQSQYKISMEGFLNSDDIFQGVYFACDKTDPSSLDYFGNVEIERFGEAYYNVRPDSPGGIPSAVSSSCVSNNTDVSHDCSWGKVEKTEQKPMIAYDAYHQCGEEIVGPCQKCQSTHKAVPTMPNYPHPDLPYLSLITVGMLVLVIGGGLLRYAYNRRDGNLPNPQFSELVEPASTRFLPSNSIGTLGDEIKRDDGKSRPRIVAGQIMDEQL